MMWTALIILTSISVSTPILSTDDPANKAPVSVTMKTDANAPPAIDLTMPKPPVTTTIGRMTGVEANTSVNVPSSTTITFDTMELCAEAKASLEKAPGVASVTCVRTK